MNTGFLILPFEMSPGHPLNSSLELEEGCTVIRNTEERKGKAVIRIANRALILNYKTGEEAKVHFVKLGRKSGGLSLLVVIRSP